MPRTDPSLPETVVPFRFGGHVALDFVNTVDSWVRPVTRDYIDTFAKLVGWTCQVGLIDTGRAQLILRENESDRAKTGHGETLILRSVLERIFGAVINDGSISETDMQLLNALLIKARQNQHLAYRAGSFEWIWNGALDASSPILLIALAAADLLRHHDLTRLKRCPGPDGCGWLFLDESRNRSRRWCSMEYCGSFAKARRFAKTHRAKV